LEYLGSSCWGLGVLGDPWGIVGLIPEAIYVCSWKVPGGGPGDHWRTPEGAWGSLGKPMEGLGCPGGTLRTLWPSLGTPADSRRGRQGPPGMPWESRVGVPGDPWGVPGDLCDYWGAPGRSLGVSGGVPGGLKGPPRLG